MKDVKEYCPMMDESGGEYRRRRGKWEGHRHGARNRRYFEQVEGGEIIAHSSGKEWCITYM